jgi:hypothetical protein
MIKKVVLFFPPIPFTLIVDIIILNPKFGSFEFDVDTKILFLRPNFYLKNSLML